MAYRYACGLVQQVRSRFPDAGEDWWIEVSDGINSPTLVMPAMVPGANLHSQACTPPRTARELRGRTFRDTSSVNVLKPNDVIFMKIGTRLHLNEKSGIAWVGEAVFFFDRNEGGVILRQQTALLPFVTL